MPADGGTRGRAEPSDAREWRVRLSGWGRTAPSTATVTRPRSPSEAAAALHDAPERGAIPRGLGRAYGDAAQNGGGRVVDCTGLDGIVALDAIAGTVRAGGGLSLDALARAALPPGWFIPVSPGTRFVTVGGAIAADVHGKNHHQDGAFSRHVAAIELALPSGEVRRVTPSGDPELFDATAGGMGLTGAIVEAEIRMLPVESRYILVDTERTGDLDATMAAMAAGDEHYRYSVAWVDLGGTAARGRGVLTRGDHAPLGALPERLRQAALDHRPRSLPALPWVPSGLVNRLSVRAFNELWFRKAPAVRREEPQTIEQFFYPLDIVSEWNRVYGSQGLLQYQVVVPYGAEETFREVAFALANAPVVPSLAVLKRFGEASGGHLSFPMPGWTLAVDFPAVAGSGLAEVLDECDCRVAAVGGRVYLAKDSRMRAEHVASMYPRLEEWRRVVREVDPEGRLASDLERRLDLTGRRAERRKAAFA